MLIEVRVKVKRVIDSKARKRMETYLLDKDFFAQAEYAVTVLLQTDATVEDFSVQDIRLSQVREVDEQTVSDSLPSFIVTLVDVFHDDEGNEKRLRYKVLLWAGSLMEANRRAAEFSRQGYDMVVEGIKQVDCCYLIETEAREDVQDE